MENNKNNLPKNDFARLDRLEREEHLDMQNAKRPLTAMPYNALFTFPTTSTGYPVVAPFYNYSTEAPKREDRENL